MSRIVSQLAARLEMLSSSLLELIVVGPHRPVSQFRREPLVNGIYVVHAPHGAILLSGLVLETDDAAMQASRADRIDALGNSGFASTYRLVDLGTADLACQLGRIVFDLFGGAFPLSQDQTAQKGSDAEGAARAAEVPEAAPAFRKRSRPRREETPAETPAAGADDAPVPATKRRGRPPKNQTAAADIPAPVNDVMVEAPERAVATVDAPVGTINSGAPVATLVDSKDEANRQKEEKGNGGEPASAFEPVSNGDGDDSLNEAGLIMTKNQRREKRRRELAMLLKNGEG